MSVAVVQNTNKGLLTGKQQARNNDQPDTQGFGAEFLLGNHPDEEHLPAFAHIALKVSSLDELRTVYERAVEKGIPIRLTVNHGCSFAIYLGGPDGKMIEVYWPTGDMSISGRPCRGETR